MTNRITNNDEDLKLAQTPTETYHLCLNPGYDEAPRSPLCPVCEEEIRPISNGTERRFVCECDQIWQFTFDRENENDDGGWVLSE